VKNGQNILLRDKILQSRSLDIYSAMLRNEAGSHRFERCKTNSAVI
jgi:hypothetical protein